MGKKDTITKEYMKNPVIFADAFNQFLYGGEQKIKPDQLREMDTTEIAIPYGADGTLIPEQKYRDVLKLLTVMTDGIVAYCILGIENQSDIHYALPVKNGNYDFMQLAHQVSEAASSHKKELKEHTNEDVSSDEFLSGFWKTDKLLPVVTLVIYWGAKEWDAPLSLREMYSCQESAILEHAADYHVNLIAPNMLDDDDIDRFQSNLREVLLYIKYSNNKEKLSNIVNNDENFKKVEKQAADVINIMTGSKLKYPEGKEINMCLAIEQMRNESELLGEIKGAVRMCRKFGASYEKTVQQIIEDFDISEDEAEMYVKKYWE